MPPLSQTQSASLNILAALVEDRTGLHYNQTQMDFLADKLFPLMAARGLQNVLDYYYFLRYDEKAGEEWARLQSALAVNETYFWREYEQIRAAVEVIVPHMQSERMNRPLRIWHAACATGEEPYSMAIALSEANCFQKGVIEIIGTDFNRIALEQARKGVFRQRSFRGIPQDILKKYFIPLESESYELIPEIRNRVDFRYLNLVDSAEIAKIQQIDILFCRNVFIYFEDQAIKKVLEGFYRALEPGGILFVAAVESLLRLSNQFDLIEVGDAFGYCKRGSMPTTWQGGDR